MSGAHEPTVQFFANELQNSAFSDDDLRTEFYTLSQAMDEATKEGLMAVLKQHHPHVAERIERELGAAQ